MTIFLKKAAAAIAVSVISVFSASGMVNVRDFGAKGDGVTLDTKAINDAIAAAASQGGGMVLVPAGRYLVHSIHLASHIDLHLENGAVLVGAEVTAEGRYDLPEPGPVPQFQDFGHSHWENSMIWGIGLDDVRISGFGMIDGHSLGNGYRTEDLQDGLANKAIALKECTNVTLSDITIYHGGHFAILATGVDNILITNLTIDTNRDGIDIDCCRNVRICDCLVNSPHDDGIVLKASYALGKFRDTENVVINGCNLSGYDVGSVLNATYTTPVSIYVQMNWFTDRAYSAGRIKLGTETSGGFKNITVSNCSFDFCGGFFVESMDGGIVEDVVATNLVMRYCTDSPIFIRLGERMRSPEGTPVGAIRRVLVSDVDASFSHPSYNTIISGTPGHCIEDVTLRNIHLHSVGSLTPADAIKDIPECEAKYPDPWMFGETRDKILPFKGMMLRHVDGIDIDGLYFGFDRPDTRQLFWIRDVKGLEQRNVKSEGKNVRIK